MSFTRALCFGFLFVGLMGAAAAARVPSPPPATPYTLAVSALVGPTGTDVVVQIAAPTGGALPTVAKKLELFAPHWSQSLKDVALSAGQWTAHTTGLPRGTAITAHVEFKTTKTWNLGSNTVALYRPDLYFSSVGAPTSAKLGDVLAVTVLIGELRGDLGASFDLAVSGLGVQGVIASGVRVNALGSTQLLLEVKVLALGAQTVTLTIQNEIPGDYDPSNNTTSFVVQVSPLLASTQYYGGYHRSQGTTSESFTNPDGSTADQSTNGNSESLNIVASSSQAMSWPMSATMNMYADGVQVYSVTVSDVTPTTTYSDGSSAYIQTFAPDYTTYLWITLYASGSTPAVRFITNRSAADYVQVITQGGVTTTSVQQYGTFMNATVSSQMTGTLTSALGAIGGDTGLQPIVYSREDVDTTVPFPNTAHLDLWDSYSSGNLH